MPLFHRRTIQGFLRELPSPHLPLARISHWVKRLNDGPGLDAISAEWEIAIVHAFSQLGKTESEEQYGARKPDVIFWADYDHPVFVADICCPSRSRLETSNPVDAFMTAFCNLMEKEGFAPELFHVHVDRRTEVPPGYYEHRKHHKDSPPAILHLPKAHLFKQHVFNGKFYEFLGRVRLAPKATDTIHIYNDHANVKVTYEPGKQTLSLGYAAFDQVNELKRNSIYRSLRDKAKQLKETNLSCCKGIIVCDGGHPLLSQKAIPNSSYSLTEILNEFLRNYSKIDVVIVLGVETRLRGGPVINMTSMSKDHLKGLPLGLGRTIESMWRLLPEPQRGARNAIRSWENKSYERTQSLWNSIKRTTMKTTVRVSTQSLLKLMAGKVTVEDLFSPLSGQDQNNEFAALLSNGFVIKSVRFQENPAADDDWLDLEFSGPDASVSPFME